MTSTKTIAVTESVWERLKERMKRELAKNLSEVVAKLLEETSGVPSTRFGVHRTLKMKFTQEEHEEITKDLHMKTARNPTNSFVGVSTRNYQSGEDDAATFDPTENSRGCHLRQAV